MRAGDATLLLAARGLRGCAAGCVSVQLPVKLLSRLRRTTDRRRGNRHLGSVVWELCVLRWRGHFLADARDAPAAVLQALAAQIGVLPMPLDDYP